MQERLCALKSSPEHRREGHNRERPTEAQHRCCPKPLQHPSEAGCLRHHCARKQRQSCSASLELKAGSRLSQPWCASLLLLKDSCFVKTILLTLLICYKHTGEITKPMTLVDCLMYEGTNTLNSKIKLYLSRSIQFSVPSTPGRAIARFLPQPLSAAFHAAPGSFLRSAACTPCTSHWQH